MSTTKSCIINIKKLNKFLLDLDNKYDINSGACALIASIIAKYLENNDIKYRTKVYYYEDTYEHAWHYSLVVDNIEINHSTYEYQEWEHEITRIENNWNSNELLEKYNSIIDESNYWKCNNEKKVINLLSNFLSNEI